jgi:hypothetical protein
MSIMPFSVNPSGEQVDRRFQFGRSIPDCAAAGPDLHAAPRRAGRKASGFEAPGVTDR